MSPRAWLGLLLVVSVIACVLAAVAGTRGASTLGSRLVDAVSGRTGTIEVSFDTAPPLEISDPVYTVQDQGFALVGRVIAKSGEAPCRLELEVDPLVPRTLSNDTRASAMNPGQDLAWVLRTLVPPTLRQEILAELKLVWENEREATLEVLGPLITEVIQDLASTLGESLPPVLREHQEELDAVVAALRDDIYPRHLQAVVEEAWLPRVRDEIAGVTDELGAAVGKRVRFDDVAAVVWSSLKDKVGLGKPEDVDAALSRILSHAALPALEEKAHLLLQGVYAATRATATDPEVRTAVLTAAESLQAHPAWREALSSISRSWLLENAALGARLRALPGHPRLQALAEDLWKKVEPVLEKGLERMLSRPEGDGMSHQLVRVLRRVVLRKDQRYLLLIPGGGPMLQDAPAVLQGSIGRDP